MKTSFYLVLWPILQFIIMQINRDFIPFILHRSFDAFFEIDVVIVLILYWIINHTSSSQQYCLYETKLRRLNDLGHEQDGNNSRLKSNVLLSYSLNSFVIIVFCFSVIFIAWTLYHHFPHISDWWVRIDWIGLVIYLFFTCRIVSKSMNNIELLRQSCRTHTIDAAYIEEYKVQVSNHVPKKFIFYQRINLVSSIISIIVGLILFTSAIDPFLTECNKRYIGIACLLYIYGSLALYYGLTDFISVIQNKRITTLLADSQNNMYE